MPISAQIKLKVFYLLLDYGDLLKKNSVQFIVNNKVIVRAMEKSGEKNPGQEWVILFPPPLYGVVYNNAFANLKVLSSLRGYMPMIIGIPYRNTYTRPGCKLRGKTGPGDLGWKLENYWSRGIPPFHHPLAKLSLHHSYRKQTTFILKNIASAEIVLSHISDDNNLNIPKD